MQNINVSDQHAANSVNEKPAFSDTNIPVIETALQHVEMKKLAVRAESGQGVTFTEMPVTGLLVLRAQSDKAALQAALSSALQLDLADTLSSNTATNDGDSLCVRWMAPDEWLLSCPLHDAFSIEQQLRASLGDASAAIVNVSGGFTTIRLTGTNANDLLKKSTAYDVHQSNLIPGKVVNTVFAKAQVTMRCVAVDDYELIVRRSFADYVWHWIQVAAAEYGLSIGTE